MDCPAEIGFDQSPAAGVPHQSRVDRAVARTVPKILDGIYFGFAVSLRDIQHFIELRKISIDVVDDVGAVIPFAYRVRMRDEIAVQRRRHFDRPCEIAPIDPMPVGRKRWQLPVPLRVLEGGRTGLAYLGRFPFAHPFAAWQVIPGVAQDKIVNQIHAHENGAHENGRTLQKVHDSTHCTGCARRHHSTQGVSKRLIPGAKHGCG